jgi:hypothetical protein
MTGGGSHGGLRLCHTGGYTERFAEISNTAAQADTETGPAEAGGRESNLLAWARAIPLPFGPAWRNWRHPAPLPVSPALNWAIQRRTGGARWGLFGRRQNPGAAGRNRPKFEAKQEVTFADGQVRSHHAGKTWTWKPSARSPAISSARWSNDCALAYVPS